MQSISHPISKCKVIYTMLNLTVTFIQNFYYSPFYFKCFQRSIPRRHRGIVGRTEALASNKCGSEFQLSLRGETRNLYKKMALRNVVNYIEQAKYKAQGHRGHAEVVFFPFPSSSCPLSHKRTYCKFENDTYTTDSDKLSIITSGFIHYIQKHTAPGKRTSGNT